METLCVKVNPVKICCLGVPFSLYVVSKSLLKLTAEKMISLEAIPFPDK